MRAWQKLSVGALAIGAIVATAAPATASNSWNGYHWARSSTSSTLRLTVLDSVTSSWDSQLQQANADWNRSSVFENSISTSSTSSSTRSACPASSGRVRVCNYGYGDTGWLGLAQINLSSGSHIAWGTTKVNDSYAMSAAAKQHVMCQEVGHDFGLDHQFTNTSSCMDYAGLDDPSYVSPNSHDYSQLLATYNHGDSGAAARSSSATQTTIVTGNSITSVLWK